MNGMRVCIDTNVFIAVKNREKNYLYCEKIIDEIDGGAIEGIVSTLVIAEVLVGFYKNKEEFEASRFLAHVINTYKVIPVTTNIADFAARLRVARLKLPDAIILATAKLNDAILITRDTKMKVDDLEVFTPEEFVGKYLEK